MPLYEHKWAWLSIASILIGLSWLLPGAAVPGIYILAGVIVTAIENVGKRCERPEKEATK